MRITKEQRQLILNKIHNHFGKDSKTWLFGSRLDNNKKGGDIDLYIETQPQTLRNEIRCKIALEEILDIPVDLIVRQQGDMTPIARIAKEQGIQL